MPKCAQAFERPLSELPDELRPAVHAAAVLTRLGVDIPTELRGDDDPPTERRESLPQELFVLERAVHLSRVEKGRAVLDCSADDRDRLLFLGGRPVTKG
jgi:hypothetical protein